DSAAAESVQRLRIRTAGLDQPALTLSGGNQQKIVIGKWLLAQPRVLILDEPTRGIDVGARAEIYELINELARAGTTVLVVSSDLPELLGLSDRVLVLADGRLRGELNGAEATQERVLALAVSAEHTGGESDA
ncbi:ATP-binding cassette domain-containing protein, partial [Saccharopolyspora kobensis]|uniref:ATP-binding cassette domain-containing protein n=1 Tax=Saccharopolyspora kobensis TaxID=146035 RepID=UPI00332952E3